MEDNIIEDKYYKIRKVINWIAVVLGMISVVFSLLYYFVPDIRDKPCFKEGKTENTVLMQWEPSQYFTDDEIRAAAEAAKEYFKENQKNSELLSMSYAGDYDMDVKGTGFIFFNTEIQHYERYPFGIILKGNKDLNWRMGVNRDPETGKWNVDGEYLDVDGEYY